MTDPGTVPEPEEDAEDIAMAAAVHAGADVIRVLNLPPEVHEAAGIIAGKVVGAAYPHLKAHFSHAERERRWDDAEDIDFSVRDVTAEDGFVWTRLACSICGPVDAAASPRDLGEIAASAQGHYERKHRNPERTTDHD